MDEFLAIETYFKPIQSSSPHIALGIGDDAAVLNLSSDKQLLISTDTLVEGRHFLPSWSPQAIAWRSVVCNISDIVAMGGESKWISLALTLPSIEPNWLSDFSEGLELVCKKYNVALIGGDMTSGPCLSITVTIHGDIPRGKAVLRSGATVGDRLYLTGALGQVHHELYCQTDLSQAFMKSKLLWPAPQISYIHLLRKYASSAIDISDGLSSELHHLVKASNVGFKLYPSSFPIYNGCDTCSVESLESAFLHSGDEYELLFTVPEKCHQAFEQDIHDQQLVCSLIGHVISEKVMMIGEINKLTPGGYNHFRE